MGRGDRGVAHATVPGVFVSPHLAEVLYVTKALKTPWQCRKKNREAEQPFPGHTGADRAPTGQLGFGQNTPVTSATWRETRAR